MGAGFCIKCGNHLAQKTSFLIININLGTKIFENSDYMSLLFACHILCLTGLAYHH